MSATWLKELRREFVGCRHLRHAWMEGASSSYQVGRRHFGVELTCERCGTIRRDIYDPRGEMVYRKYQYPFGYAKPVGEDRAFGYEIVRENMRRGDSITAVPPVLAAMMAHAADSDRVS